MVVNKKEKPLECSGKAKYALEVYRKRFQKLNSLTAEEVYAMTGKEKMSKADMKACAQLKEKWTPERQHGEIEGVPIGIALNSRGEFSVLGIHRLILGGIDGLEGEPCYAVCMSGGYADDDDRYRPDGTIIYTGVGKNKKKDQDRQDYRNASILISQETKTPIRVIRGKSGKGYHYLGLYQCTDSVYELGVSGEAKVLKFTLKPLKVCPEAQGKRPIYKSPRAIIKPEGGIKRERAKTEVSDSQSRKRKKAKREANIKNEKARKEPKICDSPHPKKEKKKAKAERVSPKVPKISGSPAAKKRGRAKTEPKVFAASGPQKKKTKSERVGHKVPKIAGSHTAEEATPEMGGYHIPKKAKSESPKTDKPSCSVVPKSTPKSPPGTPIKKKAIVQVTKGALERAPLAVPKLSGSQIAPKARKIFKEDPGSALAYKIPKATTMMFKLDPGLHLDAPNPRPLVKAEPDESMATVHVPRRKSRDEARPDDVGSSGMPGHRSSLIQNMVTAEHYEELTAQERSRRNGGWRR